MAINDNGNVAGVSFTSIDPHAFFYENDVMTDIGTLGGWGSSANAINSSNQVVGGSGTLSGISHAFLGKTV
ncbi:MAG: hypothetical protein HC887_07965 [Desulfobacteraceae bacterium]|nr:hypothetical protein [Desulfobacteraceae bacterium]